jgi:hypothetical protein
MIVHEAIDRANEILPGVSAPKGEQDPRWQRIIDVGTYIVAEPEAVWAFVARWGSATDEDLRDAVATCLLEHLLQHHFELMFPRVEERANSDTLFADTFKRCWKLGQAELPKNAARFDALSTRLS